ncbi:MAG: paraquat-inducible protein A [Hoeflea sp.]|uniref:paraquat-inducible protein A n=1 Tax=Hoeflea sp. TaxID=1940281 RepID=UPI003EF09C11
MIHVSGCIACPHCDVIYRFSAEEMVTRTRCVRCGYQLTLGKSEAITRVVGLALTSTILMGIVLFAPFLYLDAGPFDSSASVVDVVLGFATGIMVPLAFAVLVFIIVVPLARSFLLIYALAPLLAGYGNAVGAQSALRWAFQLKPWAMAEIFMVGVAVALVKLAGMATVDTGAAFWAFVLLVIVNTFQDTFMCRNTLWTSLATNTA